MKSLVKTLVFGLGLACVSANTAQAALVDRGSGLIYDTDLDITWLADAKYAMTSGVDTDGRMASWSAAMTWAADLAYEGYTDWRLPTADPSCGADFNCLGSEMGHLFYTELGGTADSSVLDSGDPDLALFMNVVASDSTQGDYWSGTEHATQAAEAWGFDFGSGSQLLGIKDDGSASSSFAWAVRDGDVAAIPEPETYALLLAGLGLMGFVARRRRATSTATAPR